MIRRLLLAVLLTLAVFPTTGQPTDSVTRYIDSAAAALGRRYQALDDSVARLRLQQQIDRYSQPLDQALLEHEATKQKEKRRWFIRLAAIALFLLALFYAIARRRRQRG